MGNDDQLLSTKEAAEKLGVTVRAVQLAIQDGRLEAKKIGRDYMIYESALSRIVKKPAGRPPKAKSAEMGTKVSKKTSSVKKTK
jgi:excisionase family DNA binding protein